MSEGFDLRQPFGDPELLLVIALGELLVVGDGEDGADTDFLVEHVDAVVERVHVPLLPVDLGAKGDVEDLLAVGKSLVKPLIELGVFLLETVLKIRFIRQVRACKVHVRR